MEIGSGTRLGQYEIQQRLGAGGMGEVYLSPVEGGNRVQISTAGGFAPLFSPDGDSITYWQQKPGEEPTLYRVPVSLGTSVGGPAGAALQRSLLQTGRTQRLRRPPRRPLPASS